MRLVFPKTLSACGVQPSDAVLVGLSGGADSVALLHSLWVCREEGLLKEVVAAHLHHGIRGASADADEDFCVSLAEKLGVRLVLGRADVPALAKKNGQSLEQAARTIRYAFLRKTAAELPADCIAVGHHMDDQAETVLLHLLRGSGLTGLCGMRQRSGDLIRPLLAVRRTEIEAYLAERNLPFCTDETNGDGSIPRNRLRHETIPSMAKINPLVVEHLSAAASLLADDEAYLQGAADDLLTRAQRGNAPDRRILLEAAAPVRSRAILRLLRETSDDVSHADVERVTALLAAKTGTCIELAGDRSAWVDAASVRVGRTPRPGSFEVPFVRCGDTVTPYGVLRAERVERFQKPRDGRELYLDLSGVASPLTVRTRRDGDRFFPLGAPGMRKLSDCLTDRKVPRFFRDMPLLCDGDEALAVFGYTVSERVRVRADSSEILHIVYEEEVWER